VRLLVVEDSRTLADALVEGLHHEQMAVDVAYDGLQAAAKLDLNPYDVGVLDRDLPGVHGDTICRMITARENSATVRTAIETIINVGYRIADAPERC
jgi:DNA-binding response OmpR family regulator